MRVDPIAEYDPARCPLCGDSNRCARAADPEATRCWCGPKEFRRDLLERLPEDAVGRACICEPCLERHRAESGG